MASILPIKRPIKITKEKWQAEWAKWRERLPDGLEMVYKKE
jgi:hypothetical protein